MFALQNSCERLVIYHNHYKASEPVELASYRTSLSAHAKIVRNALHFRSHRDW